MTAELNQEPIPDGLTPSSAPRSIPRRARFGRMLRIGWARAQRRARLVRPGPGPRLHSVPDPTPIIDARATPRAASEIAAAALKILIITGEAPPVISGFSTVVALLTKGLTDQGHTVDVVSRLDFPRWIRGEFRFSAFAFYWPALRRTLQGYDVVSLHGPVPTITEVFLVLARTLPRNHRPAVVYSHHCDLAISSLERLCEVYNRVVPTLAHTADAVVVSSNAYHQKMSRPTGKDVAIIPWAIKAGGPRTERAVHFSGPLRVLFVGQLRSYKGLHVLLDAVRGLTAVCVTIVGDGPLRTELEHQVSGPNLANVSLVGRLSDEDLWAAYESHDVIVLPSTTTAEAYGLVLAEGMAAGCVPVASALPGVSELAGESGLVTPPGDALALRAAFLSLATQPDLLRRLSVASKVRSGLWSVDAMANQYERVFRTSVATVNADRGTHAVPARWAGPEALLEELTDEFKLARVSLSLVSRTAGNSFAQVWGHGSNSFRARAPVAHRVARIDRPVLLSPEMPSNPSLAPLLRRPELTSAMLLPIHWTRQGVSVIALSTTDEDDNILGRADLNKALRVVTPDYRRLLA